MFRQEINLYKDFEDPTPTVAFLSWHQVWIFNLIMVIFMVFLSIYSFIKTEFKVREKKDLQNKIIHLKNEFFTQKNKFPQAFFTQDVAQSIEKLTSQMRLREQILKKIANNALFAESLETLGRVIIPDVWLTDISITDSGDTVSIKGKSYSPEKMQQFITQLTSDKLFLGYSLSVNNILDNTKTKTKGDLEFDISLMKNPI